MPQSHRAGTWSRTLKVDAGAEAAKPGSTAAGKPACVSSVAKARASVSEVTPPCKHTCVGALKVKRRAERPRSAATRQGQPGRHRPRPARRRGTCWIAHKRMSMCGHGHPRGASAYRKSSLPASGNGRKVGQGTTTQDTAATHQIAPPLMQFIKQQKNIKASNPR